MALFISKEISDHVLSLTKIEDIIRNYGIDVIGSGKAKGLDHCPKCNKDKQHVKINSEKNLFQCFACGFAGNAYNFIMFMDNCSFPEAVQKLADIVGYEIPLDKNTYLKKQAILSATVKYYIKCYKGQLQARGIDDITAKAYCVGYAPGHKHLYDHLKKSGFTDEDMLNVGVIRKLNNGQLTDKFFNAVIIPEVRNGKIIDIYARILDDSYEMSHLYLYGKNNFVGHHLIKGSKTLGICEAPIDAISFYKTFDMPAVAIGGSKTKVNASIVNIIKELGITNVVLAFDNDESGIAANLALIELLKPYDITVNVLTQTHKDVNKTMTSNGEFGLESAMYFSLSHFTKNMPLDILERLVQERKQAANA